MKASIKNTKLPYRGEPTKSVYKKPVVGDVSNYLRVELPCQYNPRPAPIPKPKEKPKPIKSTRTYKTAYKTTYKQPRQEWTEDKIQQVIDMYKSGISFLEISEKMGCSEKMAYMVIYRARKDGKVDKIRNKLGWSTEQDETLIRMYNEGAVYVDIAQATGKSVPAVSMRVQKLHDVGKINHRKGRRCKR